MLDDDIITKQLQRFIPVERIEEFNKQLKICGGVIAGSFSLWLVLHAQRINEKDEQIQHSVTSVDWFPNDIDIWVINNDKLVKAFLKWTKTIGIKSIKEEDGKTNETTGYNEEFEYYLGNYQYEDKKPFQIIELLGESKMLPSEYVRDRFDISIVQNYWDGDTLWSYSIETTRNLHFGSINSRLIGEARKGKYIARGFKFSEDDYKPECRTKIMTKSMLQKYKDIKLKMNADWPDKYTFTDIIDQLSEYKYMLQNRVKVLQLTPSQQNRHLLMDTHLQQLIKKDNKSNNIITKALQTLKSELENEKNNQQLTELEKKLHYLNIASGEQVLGRCPVCRARHVNVAMKCGQLCFLRLDFKKKNTEDESNSDSDNSDDECDCDHHYGRCCPVCFKVLSTRALKLFGLSDD